MRPLTTLTLTLTLTLTPMCISGVSLIIDGESVPVDGQWAEGSCRVLEVGVMAGG